MRITRKFRDISDLGRMAGWDLDFRQLDAGEQSISAQVVTNEHTALISVRANRGFHQLGKPPNGMLTFGVPVSGLIDWFGRNYLEYGILPFNHPAGIDGVSEQDFQAFTVSVAEDFLFNVCATYQIPVAGGLVEPVSGSIIRNNLSNQRLRALLHNIFSDTQTRLDNEHEDELVLSLLSASLTGSATTDKSTPALRSRAVQGAVEYINNNPGEALTIRNICEHSGIALRTLNRAFQERFGIGPKTYLLRQRLSAVRTELLASPANTLIADVANQWGFWHMGQFARDYRNLFGELPSETLR